MSWDDITGAYDHEGYTKLSVPLGKIKWKYAPIKFLRGCAQELVGQTWDWLWWDDEQKKLFVTKNREYGVAAMRKRFRAGTANGRQGEGDAGACEGQPERRNDQGRVLMPFDPNTPENILAYGRHVNIIVIAKMYPDALDIVAKPGIPESSYNLTDFWVYLKDEQAFRAAISEVLVMGGWGEFYHEKVEPWLKGRGELYPGSGV